MNKWPSWDDIHDNHEKIQEKIDTELGSHIERVQRELAQNSELQSITTTGEDLENMLQDLQKVKHTLKQSKILSEKNKNWRLHRYMRKILFFTDP